MKKIMALLLSLLMVWNLSIESNAAAGQAFLGAVYQDRQDLLELICTIPGETGGKENFEVTFGNQILPVSSVSTLGEEPVLKSVYCLVDVSGSMKGRMDQVKEMLLALAGGLHKGDNLVIGKMGNQITDSAVLARKKKIKAEIESLTYTGEDTDLYSGIIHGLNYLQQEKKMHEVKAMVVLSDGCDDQGDGSTWREAYDAVEKADIPVYTAVPLLSADGYEKAKELGSFARKSAGGMHFPASEENGSVPAAMTGKEMGEAVIEALDLIFHVQVKLDGIERTEGSSRLSVVFQSNSGKSYQDSLEVMGSDLDLQKKAADDSSVSDSGHAQNHNSQKKDVADDPPKNDETKFPWAAVCLALLAAAAVLSVICWRIRRARLNKEKEEKEKILEEQQKNAQKEQEEARRKAMEQERERARRKAMEEEAFQALARLPIRLAAIGVKNKECVLELIEGREMTVGRSAKAGTILDGQDTRLSGIHFVLYWDRRHVYIWDMRSKNGTSVNGVVINRLGRVNIKPGDSIRAGSYEYRLYWEEQ